jgi:hypothetical protein
MGHKYYLFQNYTKHILKPCVLKTLTMIKLLSNGFFGHSKQHIQNFQVCCWLYFIFNFLWREICENILQAIWMLFHSIFCIFFITYLQNIV